MNKKGDYFNNNEFGVYRVRELQHCYLNKWDKADALPMNILREIRSADYYTDILDYESFDNNDPRSCDARLLAWELK
tara:strand:- start:11 stop:241 length:231 start_codon:yes stop_codon:yes gene_type:complete